MKYCKSCGTIAQQSDTVCPACGKKLYPVTDVNQPVTLCTIGGTERTMLRGLLEDAGIPFAESNDRPQGVANELVTGYDVKLNNIAITVPFQALPKACELLGTIETVKNPFESMSDDVAAHIDFLKNKEEEEKVSMSPAKRTTVKIISAIAFLVLVAIVVLGTDKIIEIIKGLFGG